MKLSIKKIAWAFMVVFSAFGQTVNTSNLTVTTIAKNENVMTEVTPVIKNDSTTEIPSPSNVSALSAAGPTTEASANSVTTVPADATNATTDVTPITKNDSTTGIPSPNNVTALPAAGPTTEASANSVTTVPADATNATTDVTPITKNDSTTGIPSPNNVTALPAAGPTTEASANSVTTVPADATNATTDVTPITKNDSTTGIPSPNNVTALPAAGPTTEASANSVTTVPADATNATTDVTPITKNDSTTGIPSPNNVTALPAAGPTTEASANSVTTVPADATNATTDVTPITKNDITTGIPSPNNVTALPAAGPTTEASANSVTTVPGDATNATTDVTPITKNDITTGIPSPNNVTALPAAGPTTEASANSVTTVPADATNATTDVTPITKNDSTTGIPSPNNVTALPAAGPTTEASANSVTTVPADATNATTDVTPITKNDSTTGIPSPNNVTALPAAGPTTEASANSVTTVPADATNATTDVTPITKNDSTTGIPSPNNVTALPAAGPTTEASPNSVTLVTGDATNVTQTTHAVDPNFSTVMVNQCNQDHTSSNTLPISQNKPIKVDPPGSECANSVIELPKVALASIQRYYPPSQNIVLYVQCVQNQSSSCISSVTVEKSTTIHLGGNNCSIQSYDESSNYTGSPKLRNTSACFRDYWIPNSIASPKTWILRLKLVERGSSGTILDAGTFRIDVDDGMLVLRHGYETSTGFAYKFWQLPSSDWIQIAVGEIFLPFKIKHLTLFVNNIGESLIKQAFSITNQFPWFRKIRLGDVYSQNRPDSQTLEVTIRDVVLYHEILSQREIAELYIKNSTELDVRPGCECPSFAPNLSGTFCRSYDCRIYSRFPTEVDVKTSNGSQQIFLKNPFLKEYMNDGIDTPELRATQFYEHLPLMFWVSQPGTKNFSIEIDFQGNYTIDRVQLILLKPLPNKSLRMYKRTQDEWKPLHYFAENCKTLGFAKTDAIGGHPGVIGCGSYQTADISNTGGLYRISWNPFNESHGFHSYKQYNDLRVIQFLQSSAIRLTFDGLPRGNFSSEKEQYHAVAEIKVLGSKSTEPSCLPCYREGSNLASNCVCAQCYPNEQCPCKDKVNTTLAGKQCMPYIESLYPTYGPFAGGTNITIFGGVFGSSSVVTIGQLKTTIIESNSSYILCYTSALDNTTESLMGQSLVISVHLAGFVINYHEPFVYKPNPIVDSISPRQSIAGGGILQTIIGKNFDSVYKPKLNILYTSINNYSKLFGPEDCDVKNSTWMTCATPDVTSSMPNSDVNQTAPRRRRSVDAKLNDENMNWVILLKLDGYKKYADLIWARKNAQLLMYNNPLIYDFVPQVKDLNVYKGETYIEIKGFGLQHGLRNDDYKISIGGESCILDQKIWGNNLIACYPPKNPPSAKPVDMHPTSPNTPRVEVKIGTKVKYFPGFLRYVFHPPPLKPWVIPLIVCIVLLVLLLLMYLLYRVIKNQMALGKGTTFIAYIDLTNQPEIDPYAGKRKTLLDRIDPELKNKVQPCLIDADKLTCKQFLGEGYFGVVYNAELKDNGGAVRKVAVKTIKAKDASLTQISELLEEASVMPNFSHENVLPLIGIAVQDFDVFIVLPFMENGSLRDYLQNPDNTFILLELVHIGQQACKGMKYLESQKFVHRDLAARNCMVDDKRVVKIADFGLARDIYEKGYYRPAELQPLPMKWTAIECMVVDQQRFTTKSDVWSFGVLLWEIITRGRIPYSDIPNHELAAFLRENKRLEKPSYCPDDIYDIMMSCWRVEPASRPSFKELLEAFDSALGSYASLINNSLQSFQNKLPEGDNPAYVNDSSTPTNPPDYRDEYMKPVKIPDYLI